MASQNDINFCRLWSFNTVTDLVVRLKHFLQISVYRTHVMKEVLNEGLRA